MSQIRAPGVVPHPALIDVLADRLDAGAADPGCERSCILVLIEGGIRAAIVAAGLDEAMAELRRRRALRTGGAVAELQAAA